MATEQTSGTALAAQAAETPRGDVPDAGPAEAKMSAGQFARRLGPAGVLAVVATAMPPLGGFLLLGYMATVAEWLRSHEVSGVVVYMTAFAVLAGLALLPTYAQSILGGYAFGLVVGSFAALGGFVGGAIIGYEIARRASGERVMKLIEEKPKWLAVRNAIVADRDALATEGGGETSATGAHFWRTLGMVALLRLPPNSPFALTNLVMASVRVPRLAFILGTLIGMAPRTIGAVWVGTGIQEFTSESADTRPAWLLPAMIVTTLIILGVIGRIANKAIERVTAGHAPK